MKQLLVILAILLLIPSFAISEKPVSQGNPEHRKLWVGDYFIDTAKGEPDVPSHLRQYSNKPKGEFLVQFRGPVSKNAYRSLEARGAEIIQYYPNNAYLIRVPQDKKQAVQSFDQLQWFSDFHPAYKAPQALLNQKGGISLIVYLFDTPQALNDVEYIRSLGGQAFETSSGSTSSGAKLKQVNFHNVNAADVLKIISLPEVYSAEQWFNSQIEDERSSQIEAGNYSSGVPSIGYSTWLTNNGINGSGITVFDDDTGLDTGNTSTLHQDLRGRVTFKVYNGTSAADSGSGMGHGTHTAGIIGGNATLGTTDANGFRLGMGVAPSAHIAFANGLGGTNPGANTLASDAYGSADPNGGSRITSFSWTDGLGNGVKYNSEAAAWDARVRDAVTTTAAPGNQQLAVIFSAGNSGPGASTLTSPKAAKNIVVVGNSYNYRPNDTDGCTANPGNIDTLASSSSRGPTGDGRIKPDVTAPGTVIASLRSYSATYSCAAQGGSSCCSAGGFTGSTDYILMSGTSMACPQVAGASALIFQWWKNNHAGALPSPAMNKAILINGAVDMGTADIPNNNEGWGRIHITNSINPGASTVYHDQDFSLTTAGQTKSYTVTVSNTSKPVRINVVWTDAPGAVYTGTTAAPNQPSVLVNNLDLTVTNGTSTYLGNVFASGQSTTGGTADSKNNVESVYLPAGASGTWTVTVKSTTLNGKGDPTLASNNQDYALVIQNATESTGGDTTPPTTSVTSPTNGATVSGSITISANASDNVAVTNVEFYRGTTLIGSDATSPYSVSWDTTTVANGSYSLTSKAFDAAGNNATSIAVSVTVSNVAGPPALMASFDATRQAPLCGSGGKSCDTGTSIINGRANITGGPETNQPNTINDSCADGTAGTYHSDESIDRLVVATNDGTALAGGKTVTVSATVWCYTTTPSSDSLDLYYTASIPGTGSPTWTLIGTQACTVGGAQTLTRTYTLPSTGTQHAVRANYRYTGSASSCSTGTYDDHDDLVFGVTQTADTTAPATSVTAPANGATVTGTITVSANASDNVGVTNVEFYRGGTTLIGSDSTSPYSVSWNTTTVVNGSYSLTSKAYDAAGNSATSTAVTVTVSNTTAIDLTATYNATYKAPACGSGGKSCDTGASLINGRGTMTSGNETNRPNTINTTCADGNSGTYHVDESIDRMKIATNDGTALASGKAVTVTVTVWCYGTTDRLDLYRTASIPGTGSPTWTLIGTQSCTVAGAKSFTASYTLPAGANQALRGNFRYGGTAGTCSTGSYNDRDDLVFGVQ